MDQKCINWPVTIKGIFFSFIQNILFVQIEVNCFRFWKVIMDDVMICGYWPIKGVLFFFKSELWH